MRQEHWWHDKGKFYLMGGAAALALGALGIGISLLLRGLN